MWILDSCQACKCALLLSFLRYTPFLCLFKLQCAHFCQKSHCLYFRVCFWCTLNYQWQECRFLTLMMCFIPRASPAKAKQICSTIDDSIDLSVVKYVTRGPHQLGPGKYSGPQERSVKVMHVSWLPIFTRAVTQLQVHILYHFKKKGLWQSALCRRVATTIYIYRPPWVRLLDTECVSGAHPE